jgi:uncharacterized protein (TIGR00369 family)
MPAQRQQQVPNRLLLFRLRRAMKHKIIDKQNNSSGCVVCGDRNRFSLNARFYNLENGDVVALFHTEEWHQSYPGRVHGGLIAAVLDETVGRTICAVEPDTWGVTAALEIKYRKPVPTDAALRAVGRLTRNTRKLFEGSGEILLPDGSVAASCTGKYMKMYPRELVDVSFLDNEWYRIEDADEPSELEL